MEGLFPTTRPWERTEWSLLAPDARIALVAERQRGVISSAQLLQCGLTPKQIRHRLQTGALHRLHRAVYVVGHRVLAPLARETAALMACAPGAVLSHRSAAILFGLPVLTDAVDVSVAPTRRPRHAGIQVHRTVLEPHEVTRREGLPVTTARRALEDLAADHDADEMERLIAEAEGGHLVERGAVRPRPGRRGATAIRLATAHGPKWTRSHAERVLERLVREAGLPEPDFNVDVAGCNVDAVWFEQRIALEVDSWAFHGHRRAFERDRDRDMRLREAGFTPVRLTARQLEREPLKVAAHLARLTS